MRLIWVQNTLIHENITCWIFISLRSILYSLNWLYLECLHASFYEPYSVKFAYILKEIIFVFMCILSLFCKFGLYLSSLTHLLNFPQNCFPKTCFVFPIFIGEKVVFKTYDIHRECCFLDSLFYLFIYCLPFDWVVFGNTWQKGGEIDEIWNRFIIVFI